jgi:hypothetical protein
MSANMKLASILLDKPVEDWIQEQRDQGTSWHKIALALHAATGGQIALTGEAIRLWSKEGAA